MNRILGAALIFFLLLHVVADIMARDPHRQPGGALVFDRAATAQLTTSKANTDPDHPLFDLVRQGLAGTVHAEPAGFPLWTPLRCLEYSALFEASSSRHDVPVALLVSVAIAETGCQPHLRSHAGALGFMQIVPRWHPAFDVSRWDDPEVSIDYGASYLARLGATTGSSRDATRRAIYRYNSGNIQTAEGDRYIRWVGGMWDERDEQVSSSFLAWCRAGSGFNLSECQ